MEGDDQKKPHRPSKNKNKLKTDKGSRKNESLDPKIRNPKAFAINSAVRAERKFRRTQDIITRKERVPLVDRTPIEPPPFIIAIVGPPKVGKSTLFNNLIKNFTRQTLNDVKGPVTIVSGKKRRLTLMECNNDINSMIDTAKVADLVLLLVDASFGFEMEIFEFLNICQVHGFPQIMGVLTHLDLFKNKTQLKKTKKTLKHRFWTEVYPGSKLFYLSGYHSHTNTYPKNEIHNLARFMSVMKFRQSLWRSEHAYVIADRMEDITSPDDVRIDPMVDRRICLYGFVHGTHLKPRISIHIPGLGDYTPDSVTVLDDPCPLPMKEKAFRRSLNEKEKVIYAPFSGVGGIVYDHDAVYIDLGGSHSHRKPQNNQRESSEPVTPFVGELRDLKSTLDEKMEHAGLQLFSQSEAITPAQFEEDVLRTDENEDADKSENEVEETSDEEGPASNDENESDEIDEDGEVYAFGEDPESIKKIKAKRYSDAEDAFYSRFRKRPIQKMIYDESTDYLNLGPKADFDLTNCTIQELKKDARSGPDIEKIDMNEKVRDLFVGGDYAETAKNLLDQDDSDVDDAFDYEELDKPELGDMEVYGEGVEVSPNKTAKQREEIKSKLKEKFDMEYDEGGETKSFLDDWRSQVEEQAKINRSFFENIDDPNLLHELQGFPPGSYVRVELNKLPYEFINKFDAQKNCPIVLGSLDTPNQETLAVVQARVKKHRWHPKILKSRDPIILSVGWRRFQTISIYSVHDHNMRNRMIKYTPEHLHCVANFYGPVTPQGTGILGIAPQGFDGFRITLTGTILDLDKSTELVKKLKLIGHPSKIFKKSAFVDGMFNSQLEVAKFIGAKLKSVSGIRGVIKRPLRAPPGAFRATFEDKILLSDIVFCRTWAKVDVPKFYLNLPTHITPQPRLARTLGQLKHDQEIHAVPNPDNLYTPIERQEKEFKPFKVPKKLQDRLPYKEKPKVQKQAKDVKRIAVIREPHERQMSQFLHTMKSRLHEKEAKEKIEKNKKAGERAKVIKKLEEKQTQRQKELRKKVFRTLGQMNKNNEGENSNSAKGGRRNRRSFKKI